MNAELLHDAISLLPEKMLRDVDQLRRQKTVPWKSIAALAACLCLVAGLWTLQNGGIKAESSNAAPDRYYSDDASMESATGNSTSEPMFATVIEVYEDRIVVLPGEELTDIAQPITVMLTDLENVPKLTENQRIRIYYSEKADPLITYQIEIADEEKEEIQ